MHLMLNPSRVRRARPIRRTGFTMAETLVVLVLLAIVGGSLMNVLTRQQRFYNGTGDLIALRTQLRQAQAVVGNDLRGISSVGSAGVGSDVITMTDSSIDFRYTIGVGVVCKNPSASTTIVIPPTGVLTNGNTLTSWINKPTFGDTAFIFDEGASATSPTDDTWPAFKVISLALGSGSCDGAFNAGGGSTLTLDHSVSANTLDGAPVRFVRRAHYSLYKTTGDQLWYLGYCSPDCSTGISPIAGPFQSYQASTSPDTSGIRITYFDSTGAATATPAQVARINIILRGETKSYLNVTGMTRGVYHDSLSMNIALRNRS